MKMKSWKGHADSRKLREQNVTPKEDSGSDKRRQMKPGETRGSSSRRRMWRGPGSNLWWGELASIAVCLLHASGVLPRGVSSESSRSWTPIPRVFLLALRGP